MAKNILIVLLVLGLLAAAAVVVSSLLVVRTVENAVRPVGELSAGVGTQVAEILHPTPTILPDPVTIVREVRALARLETIQYTVEKVITAETGQGALGFLFGDRLLFIAHGVVIAGVDLDRVTPDDIRFDAQGRVYLKLPAAGDLRRHARQRALVCLRPRHRPADARGRQARGGRPSGGRGRDPQGGTRGRHPRAGAEECRERPLPPAARPGHSGRHLRRRWAAAPCSRGDCHALIGDSSAEPPVVGWQAIASSSLSAPCQAPAGRRLMESTQPPDTARCISNVRNRAWSSHG